jgi:hypothetical protein
VYVHRLPELMEQAGLDDGLLEAKPLHMAITAGLLVLPGLLAWGADAVGRLFPADKANQPQPFLTIAYGYLPLVWAATLAHYLDFGLIEAGQILRVRPLVEFECFLFFLSRQFSGARLVCRCACVCLCEDGGGIEGGREGRGGETHIDLFL